MPFVNIKITPDGATPEKKAELISGVTNLLAEVRGRIGRWHLPEAEGGRYRLVGVTTDLARFELAAAEAARSPGPGPDRRLTEAMELVAGVPLSGPQLRYWSWVDDHVDLATRIEVLVADAAAGLALRLRAAGDGATAAKVCERGLLAAPLDEKRQLRTRGLTGQHRIRLTSNRCLQRRRLNRWLRIHLRIEKYCSNFPGHL